MEDATRTDVSQRPQRRPAWARIALLALVLLAAVSLLFAANYVQWAVRFSTPGFCRQGAPRLQHLWGSVLIPWVILETVGLALRSHRDLRPFLWTIRALLAAALLLGELASPARELLVRHGWIVYAPGWEPG